MKTMNMSDYANQLANEHAYDDIIDRMVFTEEYSCSQFESYTRMCAECDGVYLIDDTDDDFFYEIFKSSEKGLS